jgi:hypothetical protein
VACIPVGGQRLRDKQIHNSRYTVTALQKTSPRQQLDTTIMGSANRHECNNGTATEEQCFLCGPCRGVLRGTSRKIVSSLPDDVIRFFNRSNPSRRTMALGSTQPLTEISTRNLSGGLRAAGE